ncbi:MAG: 30S ribosomal protein S19e [Desulfurococcales archaeon]|nr:30S ribosomal protein S19e [Desulfurococcales archaeon]
MVTALEVPADRLIEKLSEKLKGYQQITPPPWAYYAKTGVHKEKPPSDPDWWYKRAASILRKLYKSGEPIGVGTFRTIYGGRQNRGSAPEHFRKGSGSIPRKILQQLEAAGLVAKVPGGGRVLTPQGRSLLDKTAKEVMEELVKERPELSRYM